MAIGPNNPNVFYAGTGEANGSYYSAGILKSTNSGASWSRLRVESQDGPTSSASPR